MSNQGSEYAWSNQGSEFAWFWIYGIWQGCEHARVTWSAEYAWICLNNTSILLGTEQTEGPNKWEGGSGVGTLG